MAIPKITGAQRDFSAGELDLSMKRADENPIMKTGARQLSNYRILSSGAAKNRPGRRALFPEGVRVEEVLMSPGNIFFLVFGSGYLRVYNAAAARVFSATLKGDGATAIPWTAATVKNIVFVNAATSQKSIYIFYGDGAPLNVPQVLTWDGVSQTSAWTLATFAETISAGGQKMTPFYRISPQNITILPSAATGNITLTASAPVFVAGMVGTRIAYVGKQVLITGFTDSQHVNATVQETLFSSQQIVNTLGLAANLQFFIGDVVKGANTGATGIVVGLAGSTVTVQLTSTTLFLDGNNTPEVVVGPNGSAGFNTCTGYQSPAAVAVWDDEVMNNFRGWPLAGFYDQGRLGLNNFPSVPSGIGWSGIGLPESLYVESESSVQTTPESAIFEIAPGKSQVLFVQPGAESSEFVFCDNAVYYIPITTANPLVPGSVSFTLLSAQGSFPNVKPQAIEQSILYVKAGGAQVGAVQAPGAYYRPYVIDHVSEYHAHLFTASPAIAIAVPAATTQFEELYAYILMADGSVAMAKYSIRNGLIEVGPEGKPKMGWLPWSGAGTPSWIAAQGADVIFTTLYGAVSVVEAVDNTQLVDGALAVNALPAPFAPPAGKGPLYVFPGPNTTVTLIDTGGRPMGTYQVDANGNIVPQFNGGEDLTSAGLTAGQPWMAILEPFVPDAQPGQSVHQRMFKRRVSRQATYVSQSTGFLMARLFSGPITPTSPPLGTVMNNYRITAWNQGDIVTNPPPLREEAYRWRPIGRSYDPRVAVIKDTPGSLLVHEIGIEATI